MSFEHEKFIYYFHDFTENTKYLVDFDRLFTSLYDMVRSYLVSFPHIVF